jgi:hypothetical protein
MPKSLDNKVKVSYGTISLIGSIIGLIGLAIIYFLGSSGAPAGSKAAPVGGNSTPSGGNSTPSGGTTPPVSSDPSQPKEYLAIPDVNGKVCREVCFDKNDQCMNHPDDLEHNIRCAWKGPMSGGLCAEMLQPGECGDCYMAYHDLIGCQDDIRRKVDNVSCNQSGCQDDDKHTVENCYIDRLGQNRSKFAGKTNSETAQNCRNVCEQDQNLGCMHICENACKNLLTRPPPQQ